MTGYLSLCRYKSAYLLNSLLHLFQILFRFLFKLEMVIFIFFAGSLLESEKEVYASGKLKYGEKEYWSKAGLTMTKSSPTVTVYSPFFRYSWPRIQSRLVGRSDPLPPALKISGP